MQGLTCVTVDGETSSSTGVMRGGYADKALNLVDLFKSYNACFESNEDASEAVEAAVERRSKAELEKRRIFKLAAKDHNKASATGLRLDAASADRMEVKRELLRSFEVVRKTEDALSELTAEMTLLKYDPKKRNADLMEFRRKGKEALNDKTEAERRLNSALMDLQSNLYREEVNLRSSLSSNSKQQNSQQISLLDEILEEKRKELKSLQVTFTKVNRDLDAVVEARTGLIQTRDEIEVKFADQAAKMNSLKNELDSHEAKAALYRAEMTSIKHNDLFSWSPRTEVGRAAAEKLAGYSADKVKRYLSKANSLKTRMEGRGLNLAAVAEMDKVAKAVDEFDGLLEATQKDGEALHEFRAQLEAVKDEKVDFTFGQMKKYFKVRTVKYRFKERTLLPKKIFGLIFYF